MRFWCLGRRRAPVRMGNLGRVLRFSRIHSSLYLWVPHHRHMVKDTPAFKHRILKEYCAGNRCSSFRSLARRFGISGGESVVRSWFRHWDGTPSSLKRKAGSGRRATLTPTQVERYIVKPIRRCNKNHVAVEYHDLQEVVEQKAGHSVSVRTIQRRGKEGSGIQFHSTIPRTPQERTTSDHYPLSLLSVPR